MMALVVAAIWSILSMRKYQILAASCLLFSAMLIVSGTARSTLQDRYFYIPNVLAAWFFLCLLANISNVAVRRAGLSLAVTLMLLQVVIFERNDGNPLSGDWRYYSSMLGTGMALKIPVAGGWFIEIPADKN